MPRISSRLIGAVLVALTFAISIGVNPVKGANAGMISTAETPSASKLSKF